MHGFNPTATIKTRGQKNAWLSMRCLKLRKFFGLLCGESLLWHGTVWDPVLLRHPYGPARCKKKVAKVKALWLVDDNFRDVYGSELCLARAV